MYVHCMYVYTVHVFHFILFTQMCPKEPIKGNSNDTTITQYRNSNNVEMKLCLLIVGVLILVSGKNFNFDLKFLQARLNNADS